MVARLTIEDRWRIVFLRQGLNLSLRQIARRLHCSPNTLYQVLQRYAATGDVKDLSRSGRPSVMSDKMLADFNVYFKSLFDSKRISCSS